MEYAVELSNELDIPLLYISTAGIFDGSKETFDDWDLPNPLGIYARSKYVGEKFVQTYARKHLILRAGWMMGGGEAKDKKFIFKIMKQLKSGSKELHIVNDRDGTPTYTYDFAKNTELLINEKKFGLYNMVCGGLTSRMEVCEELLNILGLQREVRLVEVNSNYFQEEYFAERPLSERLINRRLGLEGLDVMRDWRICLREYVRHYFSDYL